SNTPYFSFPFMVPLPVVRLVVRWVVGRNGMRRGPRRPRAAWAQHPGRKSPGHGGSADGTGSRTAGPWGLAARRAAKPAPAGGRGRCHAQRGGGGRGGG